jgi:pimeloyl-ACP methyl ester carboxylesterase
MQNFSATDSSNPHACPLHPVADSGAGSSANPLVYFFLLDHDRSLTEWGERMNQSALIARTLIREHYGILPSRTYAMGVSNGGYQVRKAIEDHPESFDGGVEWEGVLWRREGPNLIGELPVGLKLFPTYREKGLNPNSAEAEAIRAVGFPPDLVENGASLWALNRFVFWEVTQCLYVSKLDPAYREQSPGFSALADYNYATRPDDVKKVVAEFANKGSVRRPLISVHGTLDAQAPLKGHARPYKAMIEAKGFGYNYRLYEVQNGSHLDSFKGRMPGRQLPNLELIQPHAHRAFELLEAWVERDTTPPPSQCVRRGGTIVDSPGATECETLLEPYTGSLKR